MARFKYWPQAYPSHKFDTKKACVAFMSSGKIPYCKFFTYIGCFIVRQDQVTGEYALFEYLPPYQASFLRKNARMYKHF